MTSWAMVVVLLVCDTLNSFTYLYAAYLGERTKMCIFSPSSIGLSVFAVRVRMPARVPMVTGSRLMVLSMA